LACWHPERCRRLVQISPGPGRYLAIGVADGAGFKRDMGGVLGAPGAGCRASAPAAGVSQMGALFTSTSAPDTAHSPALPTSLGPFLNKLGGQKPVSKPEEPGLRPPSGSPSSQARSRAQPLLRAQPSTFSSQPHPQPPRSMCSAVVQHKAHSRAADASGRPEDANSNRSGQGRRGGRNLRAG